MKGDFKMILLLTPLLEGLQTACRAAADVVHADDEVTVDDQGDDWVFQFIPQPETLGRAAFSWFIA